VHADIYRFGAFELRPRRRELLKFGVRVKLRPQPFQLLLTLVERSAEVVSREELRRLLWPEGTFVDFEHGLNTAVKELRGVLGDSADEPRYIETLPRVGYRLIVPVETRTPVRAVEADPQEPSAEEIAAAAHRAAQEATGARTRRGWGITLGVAAVLLAGLAGYFIWLRTRPAAPSASARVTLAVLPFENLTGDPGQEYMSDGLTEEMIAQLGRMDAAHLNVIARTSVMHYKHSQEPLDQIGRELGVQYVLEGSVRRDGNTVRVAAQLIQLKDQTHLWSREYDRGLSSLLALQDEIARETAREIQHALGGTERTANNPQALLPPTSSEAYDLYLKGRYFWNKRTPDGFQQAAEYFQQAVTVDPNYARAYAGLADSYGLMSTWRMGPQNEFMPKARAAALRALEIDESIAEAHTSLALIAENYDYDWGTAEKEFLRAIQLDPAYATAHQWYAEHLSWRGRFEEALEESERARQLDPLSLIIATDEGEILYLARQYDRCVPRLRGVLDMDPSISRARFILALCYLKGERFAEALDVVERSPETNVRWVWQFKAYLYGQWGKWEQARQAWTKSKQLFPGKQAEWATAQLTWDIALGQKGEALAILEKAYAEHSNAVVALKVDPVYDPLRSDPRFQDLLRRLGL